MLTMHQQGGELAQLLSGGDRRSIGFSDQAAQQLLNGQWKPEEFLELIEDAPAVVRMRAADALEKATRKAPELLEGVDGRLLALLDAVQPKEVRWHLLQMTPRVRWQTTHHNRLLAAIELAFEDASAIVQTSALQALADLQSQASIFRDAFRRGHEIAMVSPKPSIRARARKLAES